MDGRERQRILSRIEEIQATKARLSSEGMHPLYGVVHISAQLEDLDKEERRLRRLIGQAEPEGETSVGKRSSWWGWLALIGAITVIVLTLWMLAELGPQG
jgi:hypothetical protein